MLASFGGYGLTALDTDVLCQVQEVHGDHHRDRVADARTTGCAATEKKGSVISINEESMYAADVRYEDLVGAPKPSSPSQATASCRSASPTTPPILYTSRPLPRVRRHRRGDAEVHAFGVHQPRRPVRGQVESHLDKLLAQAKPKKKPEQRRRSRRGHSAEGARQAPKKPRGRPKQSSDVELPSALHKSVGAGTTFR